MNEMTIEAQPSVRLRLDVSYDGSGFAGWALQPGQRTVCGVLQDALSTLLREPVALVVAGRTDAGVHALGQVAHLDISAAVWAALREYPRTHTRAGAEGYSSADGLLRRLARLLPADVRVRALIEVPSEFDARFAALWRRYEYRICDRPQEASPLRRGFVLTWPRALDVAAMATAGAALLGLHDFAAFCRRREGASTIRTLQMLDVARERARTDEIVVTVQADAFCHNMVRSLVGALIAVGEGRRAPDWPAGLLDAAKRSSEITVAPAHGLALLAVGYPDISDVPALIARAARTRARRGENRDSPGRS